MDARVPPIASAEKVKMHLRLLHLGNIALILSYCYVCVQNKTTNKVLSVPVTGQNDLVFNEGDNPCKVITKYCKKISKRGSEETCFDQLHSAVLPQMTHTWSNFKQKLRIDASFFINCNNKVLKTPEVITMDTENLGYEANKTDTVQDMLRLLQRAMQRDKEALATFNTKRNELKLSDTEKLELYREAIMLLPNNLFIVDQLGLALLFLNQELAARKLWANAVNRELWGNPLQRPVSRYVKGLTSRPWYNTAEYPFIARLEAGYSDIKEELLYNLKERSYMFTEETENLHVGGDWTELRLKSSGYGFTEYTQYFQKTMSHIRGCGQDFTSIKFSAIQPGTHIRTHTGPSNERLRLHLTLLHSGGARIRVGTDWHTWKEGEIIMFDDSWEHEVIHSGTKIRAVLIMDIWHPELPSEKRIAH